MMNSIDKRKYFQTDKGHINIGSQLDEIDALIGRLDSSKKDLAEDILDQMDRVAEQIKFENAERVNQSSFDTQLEYTYKRIHSHAGILLKAIGGVEQLRQKRQLRNAQQNAWWWYLDEWLKTQRKKQIVRFSIITAGLVIMLVILGSLYDRYLAPPPEVRARMQFENAASSLAESGDYAAAILKLDQALAIDPDNFNLRIQQGVFHLKQGDSTAAEKEFQEARTINQDAYLFYLERTHMEAQIGLLDEAKQDADEMLKYKPDSAEAYLMIGQIFEQQGESAKALEAYQKTSDLADAQDNVEIITTVRLRMAFLMQSGFMPTLTQ